MIFKHCAAVEKFTYFCMSALPKWNAWLSSSSSRGWVHTQQWDTAPQSQTPLPASSWAWVIWGHTFKCLYFWRELGCLKCDLYLRKYSNWLRAECFDPSDFDVHVLSPVPGHTHWWQNFPLFILVLSWLKSVFSLKVESCCHLSACCRKR